MRTSAPARYRIYPGDVAPTLTEALLSPTENTTFNDGRIFVSGRAEDDNGIGGDELWLDGHPEVQCVGERRERGGEEERDPDEPRHSESAVQAQDALILDDRRRPAPVRKLEYVSMTVSVWGI